MNCKSGESVLNKEDISNYDISTKDHILFFEFKITDGGKGKPEKVKFIKAVSGNGKMKNLGQKVLYPYQIHVIPRYNTGFLETEIALEHPLHRSVEVPGQDGIITKENVVAGEGTLSFRLQEHRNMDRVELFSITPESGSTKIYTLYLKQ
ncbi:hypothetical protein [Dyadobacter sp.]|uniref:hypothetical protein n=1 Tax=Dyadobacter sp. TaxID=1914288 RepID=UPI0032646F06